VNRKVIHALIALLHVFSLVRANDSPLAGQWFRVGIEKHGVYRITYDQLRKLGMDPSRIDPRKIAVFGLRGGMLSQVNHDGVPPGLREVAIMITGEDDGVFNRQDAILFYAEGPHRTDFRPSGKVFFHEQNLYADKNYYFITVGATAGKRIATTPLSNGAMTTITSFEDFIHHEKDEHNELRSGREWYGERFDLITEHSFSFDIEGIKDGSSLAIVSDVMAQSFSQPTFKIYFNNHLVGEQPVAVIPNTTYGIKGRHRKDTIRVNAAEVGALQQTRQTIRYSYQKGAAGKSIGFINYFSIHVTRKLALYGNQTIFQSSEGVNTLAEYVVENMPANGEVWNISDPYEVKAHSLTMQQGTAKFTEAGFDSAPVFISFNTKYLVPELIGAGPAQNISQQSTPQLLIVTHPSFRTAAERLAEHRRNINGHTVLVVTTDEIYNEFSSGRQDVSAIRNYVRALYKKSPQTLKSLLLFGKSSYDYKNRIAGNTNFTPTYESRNSLSPLETYSSDDFFGFLETGEGEWSETVPSQHHTLDIGVGRLPVKTPEEADYVVKKLIDYDLNDRRFGRWRQDIVFVADDGSISDGFTSLHQSQANLLADNIELQQPGFNTRKLFLGTYEKKVSPNGESIPKANHDIVEEFSRSVIINYTGHGSEKLWADERVLTPEDIESLKNRTYPFLVTATCEFGRHDDPLVISSAEKSVLKPGGGSIGLVTTARPVNSSTNFSLNAAFYDALFQRDEGKRISIGEVFLHTKNNSVSGVANRNFSLLGDPSMHLALPEMTVVAGHIKTSTGSDTLKALSTVVVKGSVVDHQGNVIPEFEGTVHVTLFDKKTKFVTIGRNDPAFSFYQWYNPLFRGEASVTNGHFEVDFILPKNIAYEVNHGKLSLYASDDAKVSDAAGAASSFKIGGSETGVAGDMKSPELKVYMGDETFVEGGKIAPNTMLVVFAEDESGINISNYGIGNTMMAVLDNDAEVFLLNEHFVAEKDTYKKGWVRYPLRGLPPGEHTLTVKVWDTHNNPAEKTISFYVTAPDVLSVERFGNYPNPFASETTIFFTHNRPGDDLIVRFALLSIEGQVLAEFEQTLPESTYEVDLLKIAEDGYLGKKLAPGIYLARISVRSLSDGAAAQRIAKLVVSN
jgi:hypothetical protein